MNKNGKNIWLKHLPEHAPPESMWDQIESRMNNDLVNERFQTKLAALPEHEPPFGLWTRIEHGLVRRKALRIGFIASGIAATLLLAFVLRGLLLPESMKPRPSGLLTMEMPAHVAPQNKMNTPNRNEAFVPADQERQKTETRPESLNAIAGKPDREILSAPGDHHDIPFKNFLPAANSRQAFIPFAIHPLQMKPSAVNSEVLSTRLPVTALAVNSRQMNQKDTLSAWLLERNLKNALPPPPAHAITNQSKGMSVGVNFLPEPSIKSADGATAFQTFALMAQYQLPSIDLQTGLGISYQSTPVEYKTSYASFNSALAGGSDKFINNGDTLRAAMVSSGSIDISGKERSSFLYYTIGAGKRIYSSKRFSTKLQVGGGFSLLLNNQPRVSGPLYEALSNQINTFFGKTESNIPAINRTHFDLFTGFNFNYRLYTRWSLSIEPTLKYYFNPIYNGSNARSFSTGLRTGILFKL